MKISRKAQGRAVLAHMKICKSNMGMLLECLHEMTEEENPDEKEDMDTFERILKDYFMNLATWLQAHPPKIEPQIIKPMHGISALDQLEAMIARAKKAGMMKGLNGKQRL